MQHDGSEKLQRIKYQRMAPALCCAVGEVEKGGGADARHHSGLSIPPQRQCNPARLQNSKTEWQNQTSKLGNDEDFFFENAPCVCTPRHLNCCANPAKNA